MKKSIVFSLFIIGSLMIGSCKKDKVTTPDINNPSSNPTVLKFLNPNITYGSLKDIDGNKYATIHIVYKTWMAENLRTTRYNDGTVIPTGYNNSEWSNLTTGAFSVYKDLPENEAIYGKLYNWHAVNTGKLCPEGWHIPTDAEWTQLLTYLDSYAGIKMKSTGNRTERTGLWFKFDGYEGTNESGFTGFPGGYRYYNGTYYYVGDYGMWWSSTESSSDEAKSRRLHTKSIGVLRDNLIKTYGISCRCVRD